MATIKDVAAAAGVAPSTVSRVLAGSTRISPQTHEKVRTAMRALNYHPNAIASSLARKSSHTLGLVLARSAEQAFANPFFPELLRGIGGAIHGAGYNLMLTVTGSPAEEESACLKLLRQRRVDGVILTSARVQDRLIESLTGEGLPFVLVGRANTVRPVNWVNNDNVAVGQMAAAHLLSNGHRRIGLINGPDDMTVSTDRREGFHGVLTQAGLPFPEGYEQLGHFSREGGYSAMQRLLAQPQPPTAVFCADDAMAVGALLALKEVGLDRKVALVGVNDDPLTELIDPALSTVRIPVYDLGATAAKTLIEVIAQGGIGVRQVILPSYLVVRDSSDWTLSQ